MLVHVSFPAGEPVSFSKRRDGVHPARCDVDCGFGPTRVLRGYETRTPPEVASRSVRSDRGVRCFCENASVRCRNPPGNHLKLIEQVHAQHALPPCIDKW